MLLTFAVGAADTLLETPMRTEAAAAAAFLNEHGQAVRSALDVARQAYLDDARKLRADGKAKMLAVPPPGAPGRTTLLNEATELARLAEQFDRQALSAQAATDALDEVL